MFWIAIVSSPESHRLRTFGEVAQCRNRRTKEKVAVKIFKHPAHLKIARYEVWPCSTCDFYNRIVSIVWSSSFQTSAIKCFHVFSVQVKILKSISLKKHPNLVELIEYFEDKGRPCLVFELFHMDLLAFTGRHDTCIANLHAVSRWVSVKQSYSINSAPI